MKKVVKKEVQTKNGIPIINGSLSGLRFVNKKSNKPKELKSKPIVKQTNELPDNSRSDLINHIKDLKDNNPKISELDTIVKIKSGNFEDLFKPLNKSFILTNFQKMLSNFSGLETKVMGYTLTTLKIIAYLKTSKDSERKYMPTFKEIDKILATTLLYDTAYNLKEDVLNFYKRFENHLIRQRKNQEIELLESILDLITKVEFQMLDLPMSDDLDHFNPKIKWLRVLKEPKLDNALIQIISEINYKDIPMADKDWKLESDFMKGIYVLNLVKKLGLRYINSRSNFEWFLYGRSLRKIRNFLSRNKYFSFLKILNESIDKTIVQNKEEVLYGQNIYYLKNTVTKLIEQRSKKQYK